MHSNQQPEVDAGSDSAKADRARRWRWARRVALGLALLGVAAVAHVWYWGSQIDRQVYGADALREGPITQIIPWSEDRTAVQVSRLSPLNADHLWQVVTDQNNFDKFMPYVRSTTVEPGPDGTLIEKQILDLPYQSYSLVLEIRLEETGNVRRAAWRQVSGALDFNEGAWVVERHGDEAVLRYQVSASIGGVPQPLVNYTMRRRLGTLLEAVEQRVRELEKNDPGYFAADKS